MKKSKVLHLGLQLGFWIATYTCNSWYLYYCEFYWTSCNNCKSCNKLVYNPYIQLRSNLVHFSCNWLSTLVSHTNSCRQKKVSVAFHTSIHGWSMFISFEFTYNFTTNFWQIFWIFFNHPLMNGWMNEIYMFIVIVLQFRQCKNKNY
jgi:hypothetical protein